MSLPTIPDATLTDICTAVSCGCSVQAACTEAGIPCTRFYRLLADAGTVHGALIRSAYDAARRCRADARFEAIDDLIASMLAGKIDPQQARVAIDAIRWQCGREWPSRYSETARFIEADISADASQPRSVTVRIIDGSRYPDDRERLGDD